MKRTAWTILLIAIGFLTGACASQDAKQSNRKPAPSASASSTETAIEPSVPITNTDPCATRLHDLSGRILLYYTMHRNLPEKLEQINELGAFKDDPIPLICPVSQKPYVYRPDGFYLQDQKSLVLLFDPAPSHDRRRWAITAEDPQPFQPLVLTVRTLPETLFIVTPPINAR